MTKKIKPQDLKPLLHIGNSESYTLPMFLVANFKPPFLICTDGKIKTKEDEKNDA